MQKVLLISMPFGPLERQALGISLLKAIAGRQVTVDVKYLNFDFADFIGFENYKWFSNDLPYTAFAGDWLFTEALYGKQPGEDKTYITEILSETWHLPSDAVTRLLKLRTAVIPFLRHCLKRIRWDEYAIIGFTSTFEQNIASLALAKALKALYPLLTIIFGGANWEAEMGVELHKLFPFVDYVFSGEADESFPAFIEHVSNNAPLSEIKKIPGLIYRNENGETTYSGKAPLIKQMDDLPIPDFSDYFEVFRHSSYRSNIVPSLLLETSRGCWWGAKNHCTFCGLNGGSMAFRSKTSTRVLEEINYLSDTWNITFIECVDNILDMQYFHDLMPKLAENPNKFQFFYEVKANLNRKQIELMHLAGIRHIQPGIESMNNHILQLMHKGTTALQNILLLRLCKEYGISAEWNILYGFPGENQEDYSEMLSLLHSIRFLPPPNVCGPIRLDRFSPYFNSPEKYGLKNLRPISSIKYIYPFPLKNLMNISYYFDFDYEEALNPQGFANEVIAFTDFWRKNPERGVLDCKYLDDGSLLITDSRSNASIKNIKLRGIEQSIFEYCDEIRTSSMIKRYLEDTYKPSIFTEESISSFLNSLVANNLVIHDKGRYLSLAIGLKPASIKSSKQSIA
ncbi:MAG TPA: RiPP maturation radical SAM C-methyltransferase [Chitinophagales bacterium]|nr:RiPP maturation radical SAM C-methyltransferase [Chitinophagales bacterium]